MLWNHATDPIITVSFLQLLEHVVIRTLFSTLFNKLISFEIAWKLGWIPAVLGVRLLRQGTRAHKTAGNRPQRKGRLILSQRVHQPNLRVHPATCLTFSQNKKFEGTLTHYIHWISVFSNQGVNHGKHRHQPFQKLAQIFVGLQLKIFKPREFYSIEIFAVQSMTRQS